MLSQELVNVFKELIPSSLSLQMEAILTPCIAVILRKEGGSLSELQRFMDDSKNRDLIALGLKSPNPSHQEFFRQAFQKRDYGITKQSVYTRIQSLLNHKVFYELINGKSTINLKGVVDSEKVIILNLSQGKLGTEMSATYGKFIIAMLTSIALKRAHKPKHLRIPTYLFIDEFHNYVTNSIEKILAETRKYGLHLIASNQNLSQIDSKKLKDIILANSRNKFVGANSPTTLTVLAKEINVKAEKLQEMPKFKFYVKSGNRRAFPITTLYTLSKRAYQVTDEEKKQLRNYLLELGQYRDRKPKYGTDEDVPFTEAYESDKADSEKSHESNPDENRTKEKTDNISRETEQPDDLPRPKFTFKEKPPKSDD